MAMWSDPGVGDFSKRVAIHVGHVLRRDVVMIDGVFDDGRDKRLNVFDQFGESSCVNVLFF